jgi:hypothetical protein
MAQGGTEVIPIAKMKFLIGLAPLVIVAAFVAAPAAEGAPHVYKNGVIAKEGTPVRTIEFGNAKFQNGVEGEVECKNILAGFLENPVGGGNAIGKVQAHFPFECVNANCIKMGGKFVELSAEHLPWRVEVTEPSAGVFRQKTGTKSERGGAGSIEYLYNCEGISKPHPFGELSPLSLNNGTAIGLKLDELDFDLGGSELESEVGAWKVGGKLKTQGYAAQELIEVKNP